MKARSKPKLAFSGTKNKKSWLKRLPLWRGKGRLKSSRNPVSIRLEVIDALYKDKEIVDLKSVIDKKIVNLREAYSNGAKIIGGGKITKVLSVKIACTKLVKDQVEKAGGSVDNSNK